MDIIKKIKLALSIIDPSIRDYTRSGNIMGILDGLEKALSEDDVEGVKYFIEELDNWYKTNIDNIRSNQFVSNIEAHERNVSTIAKLREELDNYSSSINNYKIQKNSILYTAFDEYRIIRSIGQGGNGTVYEAVNTAEEHVAIKVIDISKVGRDKRKRFKNEINFCQSVDHRNIIKVIDSGRDKSGQFAFYIMPLYKETLRSRMSKGISPSDAVEIFDTLLAGLDFAHSKNVYHRDIKPENILFDENSNNSIIADFGIAHFPEDMLLTSIKTKVGDRMANFQYAAPEQKEKGAVVDGRADVFAAGLILNEMFTGKLMAANDFVKIGDINSEYSFLDPIVEKLYTQEPEKRLFPASKIRNEVRARTEIAESESQIKDLSNILRAQQENSKEYQPIDVPTIVSVEIKNNRLFFKLGSKVSKEWFQIFSQGLYNHSALMRYETEKFQLNSSDTISVGLSGTESESTIEQIFNHFKEWLPTVTSIYNTNCERDYERGKREKIEETKKEIEKREKAKSLNEFVRTLV